RGVQHHQPFAAALVGDAGDYAGSIARFQDQVQLILDLLVGHHFAADFAESRQAVGQLDETVVIDAADVAGNVPAVADHILRGLFTAQVALHDVGPIDHQQPFVPGRSRFERVGIDDPGGDAGERLADGARPVADLFGAVLLPVRYVGR